MSQDSSEQAPTSDVIAQMRKKYDADPLSVPTDWQDYFKAVESMEELKATSTPAQREKVQDQPAEQVADETRFDLPPLPLSKVEPPTSPYAANALKGNGALLGSEGEVDQVQRLRGPAGAIVKNMETSLSVPTATSARQIPAKVLIENRSVINNHLARTRGGKVSFTHLIGYAVVETLTKMPSMNVRYEEVDGKPNVRQYGHVGFGLAIDLPKKDGTRTLMVPVIHEADRLDFQQFVAAYEDLVARTRAGKLTPKDFQGASMTLTNPGTLGTSHSVPRLMAGQGTIIGVGATAYPAEWAGASPTVLARMGVGKAMYMTSTYDHRVIQGAASGEFLRTVEEKLTGKDGFYERVFRAMEVPYEPFVFQQDYEYSLETEKGKPARIAELIHAYRSRGHLAADTDPLAYRQRRHPDLSLANYGLTVWDLDRSFPTGGFGGAANMTLRQILTRLRDTYTRSMGIEYMHIQDPAQRAWLQRQIETPYEKPSKEAQRHILSTLSRAEAFETFLQTKYVGQKRFSLEGGESLIPLLDTALTAAARRGLPDAVIGMAHRGRLNVLANIGGKSYGQIFSEFEGNQDPRTVQGSGDVKYHLGTEGVFSVEDGVAIRVTLAANPSHLEAADGVLEGICRAKLDKMGQVDDYPVLPILIHGDAAFVGQGVVYEVLNMSQLPAYRVGGTLHVIVNNQIGFTTGPASGRSTRYCTDMARGLQIPVFHVNGDDPEEVVRAANLAFSFREEFHKDVIIDMVCYRRRGHNEGDDPSMTQPIMYNLINQLPSTRSVYTKNLIGRGDITEEEARASLAEYNTEMNRILTETREHGWSPGEAALELPESQRPGAGMMVGWDTAVPRQVIERIGDAYLHVPEHFTPHPKMRKLMERRHQMSREGKIDWGFGELLAFGSLLIEGTPVRMSGEDCRRGTFVQRHAVLHDHDTGREWTPLDFLTPDQKMLSIYDSSLSEYGPLAFEYGYSVERPSALVLWEAQFGDFVNGAQLVVDEFISAAEQKWGQHASLVMLLPHGYEGQGPDHSSARIERYLQLAAQNNMRITQPSTPAQHFHLLRSQAYQRPRKPLIVFTPKQLLRLNAATSPVEDFTRGSFHEVLQESQDEVLANASNVDRIILTSGRVYYDLVKARAKRNDKSTAIVRLEQYYPLAEEALAKALGAFPSSAELVWVQDEPRNMGAWPFLALNITDAATGGRTLRVVSRPSSAAPSAGTAAMHAEQNERLMEAAFQR
ncbi:multifunctional oxoglutarate decarboxylase/oxoglutarate dehydrogenase thiamine pyrophosphate-binding subunit/dihydrolipoyllysine-residue succinyltransferase subunit [Winkia neuii]|uniref:multifunctional oxoglutarate decarboxylase/oxoglutarate dehydrogenase thiamine pyrophosphate-binding subunit/dihydrolipoyllysine-residue succinyltransferase subunit n=1 Tax=Winkia neuii TaxID=33007 RepID=UPI002543ABC5|nr:multifunctional oxoglutarate decarboxylase/oxoglutarate dehydrogenase thiamine pyrophosphate-binding subunit/dihydrolipoyllysine-residue succinyltransferase subunit [Winkia neuii]WIK91251.1 multifunctional oxoglutarate decarboxylase/oxoglutarate dehydrogenase thiamine pyrophosphate-binding subunit/dihydrolipoyllysine-residue succinyltransferase subunit [Winkia neuii]